jgi:type IV secretory pathway VirB9-like protein
VQSEGAYLSKGSEPGTWTHFQDGINFVTAEFVVTKQQGRVFYATFTSKRTTENVVGVIGWDNKSAYFVDHDGFTDATIVNKDKMTCIYRHVGEKDSVVAAAIVTRKK